MRISVSLAVLAVASMVGAAAHAQQPINPYLSGDTEAQPAPAAPAPAPVAQPIDPYSAYPAPPAYGYQPPSAGPAAVPSPPSYQQGYYLYSLAENNLCPAWLLQSLAQNNLHQRQRHANRQ